MRLRPCGGSCSRALLTSCVANMSSASERPPCGSSGCSRRWLAGNLDLARVTRKLLLPTSRHIDEPAQDALAVLAQAVVVVLVREPDPGVLEQRGGLLGEGALDVGILGVDGRGDRDVGGAQRVVV